MQLSSLEIVIPLHHKLDRMHHLLLVSVTIVVLCSGCTRSTTANTPVEAQGTPATGAVDTASVFRPYTIDSSKLITTASGLRYQIIEEGNGVLPRQGEMVRAHYHGTLVTGTVFDSSFERQQPFEFAVGTGQVIKAWDEAFSLFKVGTKAILICPPGIAYGAQDRDPIPANSTLRFDVQLLGTAPASAAQDPAMGR
jgi:peptidylprolyl isomerase